MRSHSLPNNRSSIFPQPLTWKKSYRKAKSIEQFMDYRYKWKNGAPPTQDEAARSDSLLDESQFNNESDRQMAESDARRHLGLPVPIPDDEVPVLPQAAPPPKQ
jgi:hypothetical protein